MEAEEREVTLVNHGARPGDYRLGVSWNQREVP